MTAPAAAPLVTSHRWRPYSHVRLRTVHGEQACAFNGTCHLSPAAHRDAVVLTGKRGPRPKTRARRWS